MSTRYIDYNELTVKPADSDVTTWFDVSANELKKQQYSTLKGLFLKTDEANAGLTGSLQFNDSVITYWGNDSDLLIFHNGTDGIIRSAKNGGDLLVRASNAGGSSITMLTLDPDGPTIAIGASNIAYDIDATEGISFNTSGHTIIKKELVTQGVIRVGNHIDLSTYTISGDGAASGMTMSAANTAFAGTVTVSGAFWAESTSRLDGAVDINANVAIGSNQLSYSGAASTGLDFDSSNNAVFRQNLRGIANIRCNSFTVDGAVTSSGFTGKTIGLNMSTYAGNLTFTAGILTNYT